MPDKNNPGTQKFRRTHPAHATVKAYKNDKGREPPGLCALLNNVTRYAACFCGAKRV